MNTLNRAGWVDPRRAEAATAEDAAAFAGLLAGALTVPDPAAASADQPAAAAPPSGILPALTGPPGPAAPPITPTTSTSPAVVVQAVPAATSPEHSQAALGGTPAAAPNLQADDRSAAASPPATAAQPPPADPPTSADTSLAGDLPADLPADPSPGDAGTGPVRPAASPHVGAHDDARTVAPTRTAPAARPPGRQAPNSPPAPEADATPEPDRANPDRAGRNSPTVLAELTAGDTPTVAPTPATDPAAQATTTALITDPAIHQTAGPAGTPPAAADQDRPDGPAATPRPQTAAHAPPTAAHPTSSAPATSAATLDEPPATTAAVEPAAPSTVQAPEVQTAPEPAPSLDVAAAAPPPPQVDGPAGTSRPATHPVPLDLQQADAFDLRELVGRGPLRVRVNPDGLGPVTIHATRTGTTVTVTIETAGHESAVRLGEAAPELLATLARNGTDATIVVTNDGQPASRHSTAGQHGDQSGGQPHDPADRGGQGRRDRPRPQATPDRARPAPTWSTSPTPPGRFDATA